MLRTRLAQHGYYTMPKAGPLAQPSPNVWRASSPVLCHSQQHEQWQTVVVAEPDVDFSKYRRAVGLCIVNKKGLVFVAQRADSDSGWQMPQGGIDPGESAEVAALRELREETSMTSVTILSCLDHWLTYDHPPDVRARLPAGWEHLRGQAQKWFLLSFDGDDAEVNLDTAHKEFSSWQWMPLEQLPESVIAFKRGVYEEVARTFLPEVQRRRNAAGRSNGNGNGNGHH